MRSVLLSDGTPVPALGLGTAGFGESRARHRAEVDALCRALELGYRLIDTAQMYADGGAEEAVGAALATGAVRREELFLVSKVLPHNADRAGTLAACAASLRRLRTDYLDLYLLHWRGRVPLAETVAAFEQLRRAGRVRYWGVSNFDVADLTELLDVPGGTSVAANQVYYSVGQRGIEFDLLPWQRARSVPLIAYSPLDLGALARSPVLVELARGRGVSAAQLALAWVLRGPGVVAIPKAAQTAHLRDNWAAGALELAAAEIARIDAAHPPPARKQPLAMI